MTVNVLLILAARRPPGLSPILAEKTPPGKAVGILRLGEQRRPYSSNGGTDGFIMRICDMSSLG